MKHKMSLLMCLSCVISFSGNIFSMEYVSDIYNFFTDGPSKLHSAIISQDLQEVERLLTKGIDPNINYHSKDKRFARYTNMLPEFMDCAYVPPIILAALVKNDQAVGLLLEKEADDSWNRH